MGLAACSSDDDDEEEMYVEEVDSDDNDDTNENSDSDETDSDESDSDESDDDDTGISKATGTENGYAYVDLGLSSGLQWARVNIGATLPADYGDYYAWGETETKDSYTSDNSITYCFDTDDFSGDATYDAATANWGSSWRMPTTSNFDELINQCSWTWTTQKNSDGSTTKGYRIEGPNGNSIFLPSAGFWYSKYSQGYGYYWSSTPYPYASWSEDDSAYSLYFDNYNYKSTSATRSNGRSVRPVLK